MEIPAAIRPYSMAVAPFSSFQNLITKCIGYYSKTLRSRATSYYNGTP
jgi:hypothetical protein